MMLPILPNLIYPAFTAPYMSYVLFPLAGAMALLAELITYRRLNKATSLLWIVPLVVFVNVVSSIAGILLGTLLPSGLSHEPVGADGRFVVTAGPDFQLLTLAGFAVAMVLSIGIEYLLLKPFSPKAQIADPWKTAKYANVLSYFVLLVLVIGSRVV